MKHLTCIAAAILAALAVEPRFAAGQPVAGAATGPVATNPTTTQAATKPATAPATTKPTSAPAGGGLLAMSFKGMSVEQLGAFFSDSFGKPVMVSDQIKTKKITLVSRKKHPLKDVLFLVRLALLDQGVIVEELPKVIRIRPVAEIMKTRPPTVTADKSVAAMLLEDPLRIVAKEFALKHYDARNMLALLRPMLTFNIALIDPNAGKLVITDTVSVLATIERVVANLDVSGTARARTEIIRLKHGDVTEIVEIVRWQIAGQLGAGIKDITVVAPSVAGAEKGPDKPSSPPSDRHGRGGLEVAPSSPPSPPSPSRRAGTGVTTVRGTKTPITLVPNVARNWIIVVAPSEMMDRITALILALDKDRPKTEDKGYDLVDIKHLTVKNVTQQIQQTINAIPNMELRQTTQVVAFGSAKKIIIFGSRSGRDLVRAILADLDQEGAQKRIRETFTLEHADAEEMADRIDTLFSAMVVSYKSSYSTSYRRSEDAAQITVVPDKRRNAVTVITDRDTMDEIRKLIAEEDIAIDPGMVKPKVYALRHADVGEVNDLLKNMFAAKDRRRSSWWWDDEPEETTGVGRLHGQFSFQIMPGANKLIVNTKNQANYKVIDELILELDQPQQAGLPMVIELKYANAEDLCEQLNALLAEPGTLARITRAQRGLSDAKRTSPRGGGNAGGAPPDNPRGGAPPPDPGTFPMWWQSFKRPADQVPTSNLIGKIRFVPVYRRNCLMVLAPEGFKKPIAELVEQMDQPGRQVMIKARIGEIQHEDQTTLGLRIASDPSILPPADTAVGVAGTGAYSDTVFRGTTIFGVNARLSALINMLLKEFKLTILLEPTITTSDNEAAEYFDGQDVPVQTGVRGSAEGTSTITDIAYEEVGTRLRVRPHITQTGGVDLVINLEISRIVPGSTALGNFIFDRREVTTHVIVQDGQTIMLSGIIRQENFEDVRKVPLLGDIPLLGVVFRSVDNGVRNRELVVFITPHVIDTEAAAAKMMKGPLKSIDRIKRALPDSKSNGGDDDATDKKVPDEDGDD